ncbi:MAG: hypothetical protein WKG07_16695 [Hymenobacter sp.]
MLSPAEVAAYRAVIGQAADRYNTEARPLAARDTYGQSFSANYEPVARR